MGGEDNPLYPDDGAPLSNVLSPIPPFMGEVLFHSQSLLFTHSQRPALERSDTTSSNGAHLRHHPPAEAPLTRKDPRTADLRLTQVTRRPRNTRRRSPLEAAPHNGTPNGATR